MTEGLGLDNGELDVLTLHDGRVMQTHGPSKCAGEFCCIHNPSQHSMVTFPLNWRSDIRMMERICPHGVGHPDPDSLAFEVAQGRSWQAVHGCCGYDCDT